MTFEEDDEDTAFEDMTFEEKREDLKRRKMELAEGRALWRRVKEHVAQVEALYTKYGCRTIRELPYEAQTTLRCLTAKRFPEHLGSFDAVLAGDATPGDGKLIEVLPDSFFGRIQ